MHVCILFQFYVEISWQNSLTPFVVQRNPHGFEIRTSLTPALGKQTKYVLSPSTSPLSLTMFSVNYLGFSSYGGPHLELEGHT